jgi:hypothetical protein
LIGPLLSSHPLLFFSLCVGVGVFGTSYLYIAESAFATTIAATDADDVAIMSIESEGNFNFNQAMANMLRGAAGVVSLPSNKDKDSFNEVEVEEASLAQCNEVGSPCFSGPNCCEYK